MSTRTLTFPMHGGVRWSATFEQKDDTWLATSFDVKQVTPQAVAHGLSLVNRFCGATDTGYSVAEHSCLLLDWIERMHKMDDQDRLAVLFHDAPEAMGVADCNGPLKKLIAQPTRVFESALSEALWEHLNGPGGASFASVWAPFHVYDQQLGNWEAGHFGFPTDMAWFASGSEEPSPPRMLTPIQAEEEWMQQWRAIA